MKSTRWHRQPQTTVYRNTESAGISTPSRRIIAYACVMPCVRLKTALGCVSEFSPATLSCAFRGDYFVLFVCVHPSAIRPSSLRVWIYISAANRVEMRRDAPKTRAARCLGGCASHPGTCANQANYATTDPQTHSFAPPTDFSSVSKNLS